MAANPTDTLAISRPLIQVLLGHASLQSAARYAQVATKTISQTPSPLDRLRLEIVVRPRWVGH